jgi:NAD(P)-dependent dehydrogenase (short-subunit alcohol dehydrogenase family)
LEAAWDTEIRRGSQRGTEGKRIDFSANCSGSFGDAFWQVAPVYSVTKAGLNTLTMLLAEEVRGSGVLVNAVCPATDLGKGGRPVTEEMVKKQSLLLSKSHKFLLTKEAEAVIVSNRHYCKQHKNARSVP